ncbi:MAG: hypothetical protein RSN61_21315 [Chryseobacterium sp.]|uniref:hypothetical protein n=1 Tax=Chryseobacterium sp. TaxID=1871047 RepID=UPI002FCB6EA4
MTQTLGELLQANIERNNGMISREAHMASIRKSHELAKKSLAMNFMLDNWKLEVIYKIQLEETVILNTKAHHSGLYFFDAESLQKAMRSPEGESFKNWIRENGLKAIYSSDHDGCGRESWATITLTPI